MYALTDARGRVLAEVADLDTAHRIAHTLSGVASVRRTSATRAGPIPHAARFQAGQRVTWTPSDCRRGYPAVVRAVVEHVAPRSVVIRAHSADLAPWMHGRTRNVQPHNLRPGWPA